MINLVIDHVCAELRAEYVFKDFDEALEAVTRMQSAMPDGLAVFKYEGGTKIGAIAVSGIVSVQTKIIEPE